MQLRDAAEMLGVHYQTAYAWVRQGVLPARKTGRGYEVSEGDVSALAARRASGTAPQPHIRVRDWVAQADRLHAAIWRIARSESTLGYAYAVLGKFQEAGPHLEHSYEQLLAAKDVPPDSLRLARERLAMFYGRTGNVEKLTALQLAQEPNSK